MEKSDWIEIKRYGERLRVHASGALYWSRKRWLLISDLHLGKGMHFRKKGMAVPASMDTEDLDKLASLITAVKPHRVLLLGDLFHSDYNSAWEQFASFTHSYPTRFFTLVRGNHDILSDWHYARANMMVVDDMDAAPFYLTHHPTPMTDRINIYGHVHPGVVLRGKARQVSRLPAFFFRTSSIILPAYGRFTGCVDVKCKDDDDVVLIVDEIVMLYHTSNSSSTT